MSTLPKLLRIATRQSPLALRQAEMVKAALEQHYPTLKCVLVPLVSSGDKLLAHPLAIAGGKGLFIKELEVALQEKHAEIAVHSMKDMPVQCAEGLMLAAFLERADPRDVWVSVHYENLAQVPLGASIGTASLRRQAMIKARRPEVNIKLIRGNVGTRLQKLQQGEYAGLILAAAGLQRLDLAHHIRYYFAPEESLPAIGQGIIGIECREQDRQVRKLLAPLDHYPTRQCILAERAMNQALGGNCHAPIAGYATALGQQLHLRGWVWAKDGQQVLRVEANEKLNVPHRLGEKVAQHLIAQGALQLLAD